MSRRPHLLTKSTVFVSMGGTTKVYPSIDEVPAEVRRKLTARADEWESATIVIADRQGREEVVRALRGQDSAVTLRILNESDASQETILSRTLDWVYRRRHWLALSSALAIAALTWLVLSRLL
jgi:hypothetical protein